MHYLKQQTQHLTIITIIVIGAIGWQLQASRKLAPASPSVVVSVDFERVFSSLEERVFEQAKAQEVINALTQSIEAKRQHIEGYEQEFELYEPGSAKWEELMQDQQLEVLEYQAQVEYRNLKASREESKGMRLVYEHIREAVSTLATENGWDYVFVNDAAVAFPEGDNVDMGIQISNRRMLFANKALDVTDTLIEYMNASFDEMAVR
jgi:Skp family chaperone for outer membrane proteins